MTELVSTLRSWLVTCLKAAREAEQSSALEEATADDFGDRNEPWFHGHILHRLNDKLRVHYGTSRSKGIHTMPEAKVSWLDYHCSLKDEFGTRLVRGRPRKALGSQQRFDIAVWTEQSVVGLIEVKNAPRMDQYRSALDAERIHHALCRWKDPAPTSLEWGMIIVSERLSVAEAKEETNRLNRLKARMASGVEGAKGACPNRKCTVEFEPNPKPDAYSLWWGMLIR
jgi:hypothetical protein